MSTTIQTRHYTARQASLLQQSSDIIEATENVADTLDALNPRTVHVIYERGPFHVHNASVLGVGSVGSDFTRALTAGTMIALLSSSFPTTSPVILADRDELQTESSWDRWASQAKVALQKAASKERQPSTAAARFRVERLAALQAIFGFSTQDLAAVLGISRQQLYNWLDASNDVRLQEASRVRLSVAERIAKEWVSRSRIPLSSVSRETLADGSTVFAMLSADAINEAVIVIAFDELVVKLQAKPSTRSQRLRDAGFTRRASSFPSDE